MSADRALRVLPALAGLGYGWCAPDAVIGSYLRQAGLPLACGAGGLGLRTDEGLGADLEVGSRGEGLATTSGWILLEWMR